MCVSGGLRLVLSSVAVPAVVRQWVMGRSPATVDLPFPVDVWFVDNDRHACLMFMNVSAPCHCGSTVLSPVAVSAAGGDCVGDV